MCRKQCRCVLILKLRLELLSISVTQCLKKVLCSPIVLCTRAIPSIRQAEFSGITSAGNALFLSSLERADLLVFRGFPSAVARDQGTGPSGC